MVYDEIADFYDQLYAEKDYKREAKVLREIYRRHGKGQLIHLLDVGCGTGEHIRWLEKEDFYIIGVDKSQAMIDRAREKRLSADFRQGEIFSVENSHFDYITGLFNVINHIQTLGYLKDFFRSIHEHLRKDGLFVFDCWNGIAAIRDLPKNKNKCVKGENGKALKLKMEVSTDLMRSSTLMDLIVESQDKILETTTLEHRLWTPRFLSDLLNLVGFEILQIIEGFNLDKEATKNSWKITFICRKN